MQLRHMIALVLTGAVSPLLTAQIHMNPATDIPAGVEPSGVAMADFNGDMIPDLATTIDGPDRIVLLVGDGAGNFAAGPASLLPNSSSPKDVVAGDFDGNGTMDLAVAVRDPSGAVIVMSNNGGGNFTNAGSVPAGDEPRGLSAADFDGDGDLDLAVANRDGNSATIMTNTGGAFGSAMVAAGAEPRDTAFINVDGDGDLDLAVTNHDDRTVGIYINTGGTFSLNTTLSTGINLRPDGVASADLDNDGDADLAVATNAVGMNMVSVWLNAGGTLSGPTNFPTGGVDTSRIALGDLDCDGLADAVTTNSTSNDISILGNTGGAFAAPVQLGAGPNPSEITLADATGDDALDIAVANGDGSSISFYSNQGCVVACAADITGDGVVDVNDLLGVLGEFGCVGVDCTADITGDDVVDVNDLLAVLGEFGCSG